VHPGYLVSDPAGFAESLSTVLKAGRDDLGDWLTARAEEQRADPEIYEVLLRIASQPDPRAALIALGRGLEDGMLDG